ncbi:MAG: hypothetical protein AAGG01_20575, partial [Planctomycetota bacterium]
MPASRPVTQPTILSALGAQEWLVALAALTSVALIIAACLDFGDPIERAQLEVEKEARVRADLVSVTYERILAGVEAPASALGVAVTIPSEPFLHRAPASQQMSSRLGKPLRNRLAQRSSRMVPLLIESGLFEAATGSLESAVRDMESVLVRAPDDPRAQEARLHLARWASARGDVDEVFAQRAAILRTEVAAQCSIEGTSVALLSTLVEPIDADAAADLLGRGLGHLPPPRDEAFLEGGIRVQLDPWWQELRRRFAAASSSADWEALFRVDDRVGSAVARRLGSPLVATDGGWTVQWRPQG